MRLPFYSAILLSLIPLISSSQIKVTDEPSRPFLESRQGGWEDKPDVIDHKVASKGSTLVCYATGSHPKNGEDGHACHIRFADGTEQTLRFKESIQVSKDVDVSLDCLGDKPTHCAVGTLYGSRATIKRQRHFKEAQYGKNSLLRSALTHHPVYDCISLATSATRR